MGTVISGFGEAIKALVIFIFIEFVLYSFFFVIVGGVAGWEALPVFLAIAEQLSTATNPVTTIDLAIFLFIVGTFINLILMFYTISREYI